MADVASGGRFQLGCVRFPLMVLLKDLSKEGAQMGTFFVKQAKRQSAFAGNCDQCQTLAERPRKQLALPVGEPVRHPSANGRVRRYGSIQGGKHRLPCPRPTTVLSVKRFRRVETEAGLEAWGYRTVRYCLNLLGKFAAKVLIKLIGASVRVQWSPVRFGYAIVANEPRMYEHKFLQLTHAAHPTYPCLMSCKSKFRAPTPICHQD